MDNWESNRLLTKVATMYYLDNMTQSEIAKRIGINRSSISRMLKKARETGIVTINIKNNFSENLQLEKELEQAFKLKEVIVIELGKEKDKKIIKQFLGQACSKYLTRIIHPGNVVGFTWGSTLGFVGEEFKRLSDCKNISATIVPISGGPGNVNNEIHVNTIVSKVAGALKAKPHYLYAPYATAKIETKNAILKDDNYKAILNFWEKLNIAVVGIGALVNSSVLVSTGYFTEKDIKELTQKNIIGETCGTFFDINGNVIESDIVDRVIALSIDKLRKVKFSIAVAESAVKVPAIYGALKGRFVNVLITTDETAKLLLKRKESLDRDKSDIS